MVMAKILIIAVPITEFQMVGTSIAAIFEANGETATLFKWIIWEELRQHKGTVNTMFREDNLRIAILSNFLKLVGRSYLSMVLEPAIRQIYNTSFNDKVCPCLFLPFLSFSGSINE